jgi:hypothetical protein
MSKHVHKEHLNHFEKSILKYFLVADMLSDDDVRAIGQNEHVIFLDEGLKVSIEVEKNNLFLKEIFLSRC